MSRLNLTLDDVTFDALKRHAAKCERPQAALVRELIHEALEQREAIGRRQKLARDYSAGREDAAALLEELEAAQLDLLEGA